MTTPNPNLADPHTLIGGRLVLKHGDKVTDHGRVIKVTTVITEHGAEGSLAETDTGATFTIGDYPTPTNYDDYDEDDQ